MNRYERPWDWRVWLEFVATAVLAGAVCVILGLLMTSCAPLPPTQPPPTPPPATVGIDLVVCASAPRDNYCDGPKGARINVYPLTLATSGDDGYTWLPNLPLNGVVEIAVQADGFEPFDSGPGIRVADLSAVNQSGRHNFLVLTPVNRHFDPSAVPLEQLARIRGAMWTETWNCPLGPRPGQPDNICATDFLWNYDDATRLAIVTNLTRLGYTHAVVGPLVDSDGYHGAWTPNDWRGENFGRFLDMLEYLWDHGLAPVVFLTPDNWTFERARDELTPLLQQARAQRLIRIAVRAWEPCKYDCSSYTWALYGQWIRSTLPNALALLHTVCDVDAPVGTDNHGDDNGRPNAEGWARVAPFYHGWLTQSCTFERPDGRDDPPYTNFQNWTRLFNPNVRGSYRDRFEHGYAGWPTSSAWGIGQPLKVVAGEYAAYPTFWEGWPSERGRQWGDAALVQGAAGYLDGGSLPVGNGPVPWQP